jgi:uncharacterized FlaG/YvyC family protein
MQQQHGQLISQRRQPAQPMQQPEHEFLRLLSVSNNRVQPEPHAAAGDGPSSQGTGSLADHSSANPIANKQQQQQNQPQPPQQQQQPQQQQCQKSEQDILASMGEDVDAAVDKMLDRTWQELKRDLKKEMSPEQVSKSGQAAGRMFSDF